MTRRGPGSRYKYQRGDLLTEQVLVQLTVKMKSSRVAAWLLGLLAIPTGTYAANKSHEDVKYVIMDNDWSSTGFIPFLMALDAGWEVLGLTSCAFNSFVSLKSITDTSRHRRYMAAPSRTACTRYPLSWKSHELYPGRSRIYFPPHQHSKSVSSMGISARRTSVARCLRSI
jgi:hypothetical protein